jgi:exonuclease III
MAGITRVVFLWFPLKIISWNIRHGGGKRGLLIVKALAEHDPDVIILIEYRTTSSATICRDLAEKGWVYIDSTPDGSDNGICVLSRMPFDRHGPSLAPAENAMRWLDINFPSQGLGLGILHIPG